MPVLAWGMKGLALLFLGTVLAAHADDNPAPGGDNYSTSQQKALEQFKSMRQESSLSEDAGEPGLLDIWAAGAARKQRAAAEGKIKQGKATLKKAVTEKNSSAPDADNKGKRVVSQPKAQEPADKAKKKNTAAGGGTARSPDGTTRSER